MGNSFSNNAFSVKPMDLLSILNQTKIQVAKEVASQNKNRKISQESKEQILKDYLDTLDPSLYVQGWTTSQTDALAQVQSRLGRMSMHTILTDLATKHLTQVQQTQREAQE